MTCHPGGGGNHNSRVMREWWDLPTASSTRPFFRERSGCQREQDLLVVGPQPRGSSGDEPETETVISLGMTSEWKIKTIKQKSIVGSPGHLNTSRMEGGGKVMATSFIFFTYKKVTIASKADTFFFDKDTFLRWNLLRLHLSRHAQNSASTHKPQIYHEGMHPPGLLGFTETTRHVWPVHILPQKRSRQKDLLFPVRKAAHFYIVF